MLQVVQIVNRVFTSNSYLLFDSDSDNCWLIDIGDYERVADVILVGKVVKGVFLTHTHFDHLYGIKHYIGTILYAVSILRYPGNKHFTMKR